MPTQGLLPGQDPVTGLFNVCPIGYSYDAASQSCLPNSTSPVDLSDPTIRKTVIGIANQPFDPKQAVQIGMEGVKDSGIIERVVVAFLTGGLKLLGPLIQEAASLYDDFLALLAQVFLSAQGQSSTGYYLLAAAMMEDMLGVKTDGNAMAAAFRSGGRQAAMVQLGGSFFDALAAEFTNTATTAPDGTFSNPPGTGLGGLPNVPITPEGGLVGLRAFVGYVCSFAIREGNTDALAALIPHGYGEVFKDFAEDFAKGLGIGRMLRPAMKPFITTFLATPTQQLFNKQYRPTMLSLKQAYVAWNQGVITSDQLLEIQARHGFADAYGTSLQWENLEKPTREALRIRNVTDPTFAPDYAVWMARLGYAQEVVKLIDAADDVTPMRDAALNAARSFVHQYLSSKITREQCLGAINSVAAMNDGTPLLSAGELAAFNKIPVIGSAAPRRHLSLAQLQRDYIDGLITLQEFEADMTAAGYSADDVTVTTQELLVAAKRASDKATRAAATAQRGPLAKLTVAQMQTGFGAGLFTLAEIEAELTARGYAPDAITGLAAEFRIKAGLQQPNAPTT